MTYRSILPYTSVFIDADLKDFSHAVIQCALSSNDRISKINEIKNIWTHEENSNSVLPCLSVRTAFDLYLRVMNFDPGSEVIMSAINIPDMVEIVHHHGLRVVSLDIDLETTAPKVELFESLISPKTVAVVLAHLYGKCFDVDPYITISKVYGVAVIEDYAEAFRGFNHLGNLQSDLVLFSFGVIKFSTCFGGAVVKIKNPDTFRKMTELHETYPVQSNKMYLMKILKYFIIYILLDCPRIIKPLMFLSRSAQLDHQALVIKTLRGFPEGLTERIRYRPSDPLLAVMCKRMREFSPQNFNLSYVKGDYFSQRLPAEITVVGSKAEVNNYWLFPIIVTNPDSFVRRLFSFGVDAYRGATQLNIVEPDNGHDDLHIKYVTSPENSFRYPHEAKYLIDHVVYLPVNKTVPFHKLDQLCSVVKKVVELENASANSKVKVRLHSKL